MDLDSRKKLWELIERHRAGLRAYSTEQERASAAGTVPDLAVLTPAVDAIRDVEAFIDSLGAGYVRRACARGEVVGVVGGTAEQTAAALCEVLWEARRLAKELVGLVPEDGQDAARELEDVLDPLVDDADWASTSGALADVHAAIEEDKKRRRIRAARQMERDGREQEWSATEGKWVVS